MKFTKLKTLNIIFLLILLYNKTMEQKRYENSITIEYSLLLSTSSIYD